ncbi:MAG: chemotaxis protein CheX [Spirochaetaceae bacterium]|nr:MAG: chemotaxis protein CheX [Spirochaetaceae bacterium]
MSGMETIATTLKKSFNSAFAEIFSENQISVNSTREVPVFKPMQIIAVIGLTGDLQGSIFLGCDHKEGLDLGKELWNEQGISTDPSSGESIMRSVLAEFSNQIGGRALMYLQEGGTDCNMTPPTVFTGSYIHSELCQAVIRFTHILSGSFGEAHLHIEIKNIKKMDKNS